MSLKKPSDLFVKKDTSVVFNASEVSSNITESYDKFRNNFEKVNELSEKVEILSQQLSEKLTRTDLENAMLSQLMVLDENFKSIQNQVKGLNKKDLREFKDTVFSITQLIENLIDEEIPKYKKQITKNEFLIGEQINEIKEDVKQNIISIREEIDSKFNNIAEVVDNNIEVFDQKIQETSSQVKKTSETYTNLSKILENRISKENEKFEEYSDLIENLSEAFEEFSLVLKDELSEFSQLTEDKFEKYKNEIDSVQTEIQTSVDIRLEDYRKELVDVKSEVVINEQHIKNVDKYLQEHHQKLVDLKEEVFDEIKNLPVGNLQENINRLERKIDYIKETYSKIEPEVVIREVISEGLLNEPPEVKNQDPLTPLNQNFVTLDQLQQHYRLFINRIQQQLSTLGGGGETQLKYLDDIVGIATNPSFYDNKFLKYDHSIGKFVFETVSAGGGTQNLDTTLNFGNTSTLGMNVGVSTFNNVTVGGATTDLIVNGNARITGILTIGTSSITLNGTNNTIQIGVGATIYEYGDAAYSGIITAPGFSGSGTQLTGIVTSITAGSGISVNQSTGNVVITGTALTDLSVNVSPVGTSTLSYNNSTGVFDYTPPSFVGYATEGYVTQQITSLINNAPSALDTLNELATALNNDASFSTTITNSLSQKANLSGANFTGVVTATNFDGNLTGTASTASFATTSYYLNGQPGSYYLDYNNLSNTPNIPTDTGDLTNSVGFITSSSLVGYATEGYVTNAISGLSTFSGNYNDLTNKPFIPSDTGDLTNSVGFITSGALSGYATTTSIVGFITSGALSGYATEGYVNNAVVGFITSGGSGSELTGIVTSIVAGTGISINQSTGRVIITATGGGTGGGIGLGDLSVTTSPAGISTLTYNNTTGVFNYTPPNLTGYATTSSIVGFITSGALVGYATEGYVNNAVVGFITSGALTGYATQGYVTNSLVGYATQGYVTNSLVGYATQGYVNNAVVGFITSGGSGSGLTGVVTSITTSGTGISVNQSTGSVVITGTGITSGSNNTFSGITTFNGNVFTTAGLQVQQVEETYNSYSTTIGAGATVALDCSTGNTFYITSTVNGNWTANLTNLNLSANCLTNVTLMITQGAAAYIPNALQIGGVSQTINWQGGAVPSGNNSKKDAIAFTIFYTGSAYNVFGQLVTFG